MLDNPHIREAFAGRTKEAFLGGVGTSVLRGAGRLAKAMGKGKAYGRAVGKGLKATGGRKGLRTAVGAGTVGVGGGLLAGRMTAPRR